jgi:hypothetical protein
MKKHFVDFIGIFDNYVSKKHCKKLIKYFESSIDRQTPGQSGSGVIQPEIKLSTDMGFVSNDMMEEDLEYLDPFLNALEFCLYQYKKEYSLSLERLGPWDISEIFQIQRYLPGEGYFSWHSEASSKRVCHRKLVWMFYLNDVKNAGTEFHNQGIITESICGRLLIWPADWTHLHRGETGEGQKKAKYILTGWFSLI